jgi:site-specific recombinase XerC
MNQLVVKRTGGRSLGAVVREFPVPAAIAAAGEHAARRFLEFFAVTIRNKNTRMAYHRAACAFFAWLEQNQVGLVEVEPVHVAAYVETLLTTATKPTAKQHLAAIRHLFDWLVVGQVLAVNPAHAVRGPKHVIKRGKTKRGVCSAASTRRPWWACVTAR